MNFHTNDENRVHLHAMLERHSIEGWGGTRSTNNPAHKNPLKRKAIPITQHQTILNHLKDAGSLTQREAIVEYSIQSLTKRIQELRKLGHNILSLKRHHPITNQRYVRYVLGA